MLTAVWKLDGAGHITGGSFVADVNGRTRPASITGGTYSVTPDGTVSFAPTTTMPDSTNPMVGTMNDSKDVIASTTQPLVANRIISRR